MPNDQNPMVLDKLGDAIRELQAKPQAPVTREQYVNLMELLTGRNVIGSIPLLEALHLTAHQITSEESFKKFFKGKPDGEQLLALLPLISTLSQKLGDLKLQEDNSSEAESAA